MNSIQTSPDNERWSVAFETAKKREEVGAVAVTMVGAMIVSCLIGIIGIMANNNFVTNLGILWGVPISFSACFLLSGATWVALAIYIQKKAKEEKRRQYQLTTEQQSLKVKAGLTPPLNWKGDARITDISSLAVDPTRAGAETSKRDLAVSKRTTLDGFSSFKRAQEKANSKSQENAEDLHAQD